MYMCYMGLKSNDFFVTGSTLMGSHYSTYIISGLGYPRSESVMLLVLWMVAYNIRGTGVILKVPQDNANLVEKG
jgi:hypothetical protein